MPPKKKEEKKKEDELIDFEPDNEPIKKDVKQQQQGQQGYVAIHASGFRDFLLKPELLRAVVDAGFEHPSEEFSTRGIFMQGEQDFVKGYLVEQYANNLVQHRCLPQAMLGTDVLCQAKSGMGKTAVFVLALLQQIEPIPNQCQALIMGHTRDLSYQIAKEFVRFSKYLPDIKCSVFYGGVDFKIHKEALKSEVPNVVVGSPGRILDLVQKGCLDISKIRHFVLDECDHMLNEIKMRQQIHEIFKATPKDKQVMMFTATLNQQMRDTAKKYMQNPMEIFVDESKDLDLRGLLQYTVKLLENEKNRKLVGILDQLEFNQVIIFVKSCQRASDLNKLLNESYFPSICVHSDLDQEERKTRYEQFKKFEKRIMVATDVFARGIDFERVNMVINYDMADKADTYLHRIARAGRFGTKGIAISFIATDGVKVVGKKGYQQEFTDEEVLEQAQKRFTFKIEALPEKVDVSTYMTS